MGACGTPGRGGRPRGQGTHTRLAGRPPPSLRPAPHLAVHGAAHLQQHQTAARPGGHHQEGYEEGMPGRHPRRLAAAFLPPWHGLAWVLLAGQQQQAVQRGQPAQCARSACCVLSLSQPSPTRPPAVPAPRPMPPRRLPPATPSVRAMHPRRAHICARPAQQQLPASARGDALPPPCPSPCGRCAHHVYARTHLRRHADGEAVAQAPLPHDGY